MFRRSTNEKNEKDVAGTYVTGAGTDSEIGSMTSGSGGKVHGEAFVPMGALREEEVFEHDAFTVARDEEDYVDFRSMGWFKAGLVATAEVSF